MEAVFGGLGQSRLLHYDQRKSKKISSLPLEVYSTWGPALFMSKSDRESTRPELGSCALPWRSRRALLSLSGTLPVSSLDSKARIS